MSEPIIDLVAIENFKAVIGDDAEMFAEFVAVFVRNVPQQVEAMRTAHAANDLASLRIAAHSCKSNSRDMGAMILSDLCATLEGQSKDGTLDDPAAQIARIQIEADRAIEALTDLDFNDV